MKSTRKNRSLSSSNKLSIIVKNLSNKLRTPTPQLPSVGWISERCLIRLLIGARDELNLPKSDTGKKLLNMLTDSNLAKKLAICDVPFGKPPHVVYCLKFGGVTEITPAELLISTQSKFSTTAICYFTAIQYHELSSQIPSHHHIANFKKMERLNAKERLSLLQEQSDNRNTFNIKKPSLGTLLFNHEANAYYETSRDSTLVPGVRKVRLRPSLLARITTLEQTLLDTLHKPWSCGGPAVIFEAWENGTPLVDEELLIFYLKKIDRFDLDLRVGYMLSQFNPPPKNPELTKRFESARKYATRNSALSLSLLPNVPCVTYNEAWGLYI